MIFACRDIDEGEHPIADSDALLGELPLLDPQGGLGFSIERGHIGCFLTSPETHRDATDDLARDVGILDAFGPTRPLREDEPSLMELLDRLPSLEGEEQRIDGAIAGIVGICPLKESLGFSAPMSRGVPRT